ncbi:septum formation initiator family protein [Candidatus Berkelbacteria bacterium]|nr:septum formation initiator family protein [Candidatus Berkelbacteria bacterium]
MNKKIIKTVFARTILTLVIAYIFLNLAQAIQKNYVINESLVKMNDQITELKKQVAFLETQLVYYDSHAYQELEAKRRLGLRRPGETVVLVPHNRDPEKKITELPEVVIEEDVKQADQLDLFDQASSNANSWFNWFVKRPDQPVVQ